uniref:Reverse transcriptase domain-containing protein n=1 Tax=Nothobranchius furzeri TaxID=105023 RepID=A0A8C6K929_NOTFU
MHKCSIWWCCNAVIHPLLKKTSLDPSLHSSFRPISKLPFISKILEKVVAKQLTAALDEHNIYDSFQSGFRRAHSTETALLRVSNDLLTHSDAGDCSVLVLLDLTAAFDTVDHHLLLERLRDWVGLSGSALEWFSSYLSERSFSVAVSKFRSSTTSAVIHPLLKKPSLDPSLHSSFRPISKLPFISKILEKVVAKQLTAALDEHNIYDSFQSGFRRAHSTETALLRVSNDLLTHSDAGDCSVLVLLDLTAAFDTVDHHLLLERLRDWVGLSGSALEWFSSYLSERSFSVAVSKFRSSTTSLTHGVPQGSVLGPLLFLLYLLPLQHILSSFKGISYHLYADDIQLYISGTLLS